MTAMLREWRSSRSLTGGVPGTTRLGSLVVATLAGLAILFALVVTSAPSGGQGAHQSRAGERQAVHLIDRSSSVPIVVTIRPWFESSGTPNPVRDSRTSSTAVGYHLRFLRAASMHEACAERTVASNVPGRTLAEPGHRLDGAPVPLTLPTCVAAETANEGIYVVRSEAGNYVGQSGNIIQRLAQHVSTGKFTQAEVDAAERFAVSGGKTAREIAEQLKIDSAEFGGIDNLLNKVNPIGVRRLDLMPDGYTR